MQITDICLVWPTLQAAGCTANEVRRIAMQFDHQRNWPAFLKFLHGYARLREMGFDPEAVMAALRSAGFDEAKALDFLGVH
jgi:alkylhydroperoxidase family enzyme